MRFADVIGQDRAKEILRQQALSGRLPHALMLVGAEGVGKLPLALALSRLLLCASPVDGEPCERCPSCHMSRTWMHPDLHFAYPVYKKKSTDRPTSEDFLAEWREQLQDTPYFSLDEWVDRIGAGNQQMRLFVDEAARLEERLSLAPSQGGARVVVLWQPERMMEQTANKLLKLIEEPPARTYFLLPTSQPEQVLGTIVSRAQQLYVEPIDEDLVGHMAQGSYTKALRYDRCGDDPSFAEFVGLMRLCYGRKIKDMVRWADQTAKLPKEAQKAMLSYFQRMTRESFALNFRKAELTYLTPAEEDFAKRFAPYVNERNVRGIMREVDLCQRDIEQNVNARMVFMDLAIRLTILLRR